MQRMLWWYHSVTLFYFLVLCFPCYLSFSFFFLVYISFVFVHLTFSSCFVWLFAYMDQFSKDFDAFFNRLKSGSLVTSGSTSSKGTLHLFALSTKTKSQGFSLSSFTCTLGTQKRKVDSLFFILRDFIEGDLDPVANKKVSYLVEYFHHIIENTTSEAVVEMEKLGLDEHYKQAFKVT